MFLFQKMFVFRGVGRLRWPLWKAFIILSTNCLSSNSFSQTGVASMTLPGILNNFATILFNDENGETNTSTCFVHVSFDSRCGVIYLIANSPWLSNPWKLTIWHITWNWEPFWKEMASSKHQFSGDVSFQVRGVCLFSYAHIRTIKLYKTGIFTFNGWFELWWKDVVVIYSLIPQAASSIRDLLITQMEGS